MDKWEKVFGDNDFWENGGVLVRQSHSDEEIKGDPTLKNEYDFFELVYVFPKSEFKSKYTISGSINLTDLYSKISLSELQNSDKFVKEYGDPRNLSDKEVVAAVVGYLGGGVLGGEYTLKITDKQLNEQLKQLGADEFANHDIDKLATKKPHHNKDTQLER